METQISGGFRGGATDARPLKIRSTMCFFIPFCIRMLKNKAQFYRTGLLSSPWSQAKRDIELRARDVCACTCFAPPPPPPQMKILDLPLQIDSDIQSTLHKSNSLGKIK